MVVDSVSSPSDLYRLYVEKAVKELRPYISSQTGFLHLHPDVYEGLPAQASSVEDNFLLALLLFRRKTMESFQEGKGLLARVLAFQNTDPFSDQYGNFPVLLTDYPVCRNWRLPIVLAMVVSALQSNFGGVLGEELQQALLEAHRKLMVCAKNNQLRCRYADWELFILSVQEESFVEEDLLVKIDGLFRGYQCVQPRVLGLLLSACSKTPRLFGRLLQHVLPLWHPEATTYAGPPVDIEQFGAGPATTLCDFVMSCACAIPLKNRPLPYRAALDLALLTPPLERQEFVVSAQGGSDPSVYMHRFATAMVSGWVLPFRQGLLPMRIVTPSSTIAISFPCGQLQKVSVESHRLVCSVRLIDVVDPCLFRAYVERSEATTLLVDGGSATVFRPETGLSIVDGSMSITVTADVQPSMTLGHVGMGNRIGQVCSRLGGGHVSFDWKISIDSLRRKDQDDVNIVLDFKAV